MNWEQLLSLKRYGDSDKRERVLEDETRLVFDVDFDRIIFSTAFRSLQDKTQVIPLSQMDFVHTRLTHSLETSVVGRTLGKRVGKVLIERHPNLAKKGYTFNDFGAIVASACLMHDIGNPPFGDSGEKAIGEYFSTGNGRHFKDQLTPKQYQDLIDFDGNANGFKIVTESRAGMEGGLRLSYATLGSFIKYPKQSLPKRPTTHIVDKKFGVFQSNILAFNDIVGELGLLEKNALTGSYFRHPLAYLVEAADDICYTIIDFEEGINLGLIDESYALEYLTKLIGGSINSKKYYSLNNKKDRTAYIRAIAINSLIESVVNEFLENELYILNGSYEDSIIKCIKFDPQVKDIINISIERLYNSKNVIEKEIAGYQVITDLLDVFITAQNNLYNEQETSYDSLIIKMLPDCYRGISDSLYERLLGIVTYIASLSDGSSIVIHNKIKGNL